MLTPKQLALLSFIHDRTQQDGTCPTFTEMAGHLGYASKSATHRLLGCLEERGCIRRLRNRSRAIEVIRMPAVLLGKNSSAGALVDMRRTEFWKFNDEEKRLERMD